MALKPVFRSRTEDAALHTSLISGEWWPLRCGWQLGHTIDTNMPFFFDPFLAQKYGIIAAPSFLVVGGLGSGKSALLKKAGDSAAPLSSQLSDDPNVPPMRNRISVEYFKRNLGKPEYDPFVQALGGEPFNIWEANFNPLDYVIGMELEDQMRMISNMVISLLKIEKLDPFQSNVLRTALKLLRTSEGKNHNLQNLISIMSNPDAIQLQTHDGSKIELGSHSAAQFETARIQVMLALDSLFEGQFGKIFSGKESMAEKLSKPCVAFDYTGLDQQVFEFVLGVLYEWRATSLLNNDPRFAVNIALSDEFYALLAVKSLLDATYSFLKQIRGSGRAFFGATQRLADLMAIKHPAAREIINDIGGIFIGQGIANTEIEAMSERWKWTNKLTQQVKALSNLPGRGWFVFYTPLRNRAVAFRLHLTAEQLIITESEQGMMAQTGSAGSVNAYN